MAPALKLAENKQERSEERQALAEAVAQFAQRERDVGAIEAAVTTARSTISKARQAASAASALIEEAKAAQAQAMIDSALGVHVYRRENGEGCPHGSAGCRGRRCRRDLRRERLGRSA